ncbi:hypothetical protein Emed_006375 [Eimeria media]
MAPQKYYTVGVSNKFAAFGGDSDASSDGEIILPAPPPAASEQQQQQQQSNAAARKNEPQQQHRPRPSPQQRERQGRPGRGTRGGFGGEGRGAYRGPRGRSELPAETTEETYGLQVLPEEGDNAHRRRGGFRGRRGGPPGSAGAPGVYPRREFDRHSGTGRSHEAKKHGAGGHNWGQTEAENHPQKSETFLNEEQTVKEEGAAQEEGESAEQQEEGKEGVAAVEEEEPTIDLDTYKRMQAEKRVNLPTFVSASASSKPIETDKELAAQGYVRLSKGGDEEDDNSPGDNAEAREDRPKKKSINLYEYVHIEGGRVPSFARRGGRGGSRGGRGTDDRARRGGAPRAPRTRESAPDLKDTQAFPTLGAR